MEWIYSESGNYWCASRPMFEGCNLDFIYTIFPMMGGGYTVEACNNAYGACRVAVRHKNCVKASVFHDLAKLMKDIENGNTFWLYTSHCNCIGEITKEER